MCIFYSTSTDSTVFQFDFIRFKRKPVLMAPCRARLMVAVNTRVFFVQAAWAISFIRFRVIVGSSSMNIDERPCRYSLTPADYEQTIFYLNENCRSVKKIAEPEWTSFMSPNHIFFKYFSFNFWTKKIWRYFFVKTSKKIIKLQIKFAL